MNYFIKPRPHYDDQLGILVTAEDPDDGTLHPVDISQLDEESVRLWLCANSVGCRWAADVVLAQLGYKLGEDEAVMDIVLSVQPAYSSKSKSGVTVMAHDAEAGSTHLVDVSQLTEKSKLYLLRTVAGELA